MSVPILESPYEELRQELYGFGFRDWDDTGLLLMPHAYYDRLESGQKLKCIDGATYTVGVDHIDDDYRAGLLAYGVTPENYSKTLTWLHNIPRGN